MESTVMHVVIRARDYQKMLENWQKQVQNVTLVKTHENKSCWKLNFTHYACHIHHYTQHTE